NSEHRVEVGTDRLDSPPNTNLLDLRLEKTIRLQVQNLIGPASIGCLPPPQRPSPWRERRPGSQADRSSPRDTRTRTYPVRSSPWQSGRSTVSSTRLDRRW